MPRAIWSGSIAFGLVNAPVRFVLCDRERLGSLRVRDGVLVLAALRESVARVTGEGAVERGGGNVRLSRLRMTELRERAQALDVEGRSRMSKQELVDAIEAAGG